MFPTYSGYRIDAKNVACGDAWLVDVYDWQGEKLQRIENYDCYSGTVDNVVLPSFLNSIFDGERPVLPMIDVALSKENALPFDMWGLLSMSWKPAPQDGVTVFLRGWRNADPTIAVSGSTCRR